MINDVIQLINDAIVNRCSVEWQLKVHGLATPVIIESEDENENKLQFPSVIDHLTGDCEYVFIDDEYHCGWYHRLLSKTYGTAKGFGDSDKDVEIADIVLVCWGSTIKCLKTSEQFETSIIIPSMPNEVKLISTNFDQFAVFSQEFKKIDYNINPEQFLFALRYRVQYPFIRGCR